MEEKSGKLSDESMGVLVSAVNILRSSGKIDSLEKIRQAMTGLKGKMDDDQVFFLLKQANGDGRITKIALTSGCLSYKGAIELLKENHFESGLCENALTTYPGDDFAKKLLEMTGEDSRLLKIISSAKISADLKMLLAIKSGYSPCLCTGDACNAATSLLATIAA